MDKLDKPIGTKESIKLAAVPIVVKTAAVENVKKKTGETVGEKVVLSCKHPDSEDLIAVSNVLYLKAKSVKQSALWYNEDTEGNIAKNSALAETMRYYKITAIKQFAGLTLSTELDDKQYLAIKAY